jgi:hypothetical protein
VDEERKVAALAVWLALGTGVAQAQVKRILLDEAHNNYLAIAESSYRSFVALARENDFQVRSNTSRFDESLLSTTDLLVIANAQGAKASATLDDRAKPAFTSAEVGAVREWVSNGGALLLITDHYPFGRATQILGTEFGVSMSGGWTDDPAHRRSIPSYDAVFGYLEFSRRDGLLADHAITKGVERVTSTTGESLRGPEGSVSLLRLSITAVDWIPASSEQLRPRSDMLPRDFNPCPGCDRVSAAGRSQGLAIEFGRGRVVVLGEMGIPIENRQFTINVLRWLAREL